MTFVRRFARGILFHKWFQFPDFPIKLLLWRSQIENGLDSICFDVDYYGSSSWRHDIQTTINFRDFVMILVAKCLDLNPLACRIPVQRQYYFDLHKLYHSFFSFKAPHLDIDLHVFLYWSCVCVYVYACTYVRTCVRMYICMYVCTYVCEYVCMFVCIYACIYVFLYVCMCVCVCVCKPWFSCNQRHILWAIFWSFSFLLGIQSARGGGWEGCIHVHADSTLRLIAHSSHVNM